ncbi:GTPase Era [Aliifodinibius sp. S!AR15-10]|uniref:GTPase Era n=1 Tax=Aliifodinibius sp. S!AR15-10 TaxID=2950437 RepID=UPI002860A0FF|nr:GTPase Era [Aliifodinibius sp. S!AR15-10]MDR8393862.1 GTPase Era [Aliifodinibius sp. S!AR15-10]
MTKKEENKEHKSGYVAIVGKPNAGKSTLMNQILGSKISITTPKPQTTRHQIIGIHSEENLQIIFLDTPGIIHPRYELQKAMMSFVDRARSDADIVLFLVEAGENRMPDYAFDVFKTMNKPIVLVVNKMDTSSREQEKEMVESLNESYRFADTVYISALTGEGVPELMNIIYDNLKPGPPYYPKEMLSEQPVRFFVAELIREQLFMQFEQEIPYSSTVDVIQYDEREDLDYINAEVIVNRNSQKGILIGKGGKAIKELGKKSRQAIQDFVGKKVFLDLHVKVRDKWRENPNMVRNFGYR